MSPTSATACVVLAVIFSFTQLNFIEHFVSFFAGTNVKIEKLSHDVAIGVLSARDNIAQRQAIRETWAGYIYNQTYLRDKLLVKFIVGNKGCDVPRDIREDSYSCKSIAINTSAVNLRHDMVAFIKTENSVKLKRHSAATYFGVDFKVNYPLVVQKLGAYDTGSLDQGLTVTVYDIWTQEPVISVDFTPDSPGILQDGFRYKNVDTYLFPKDFQGTIVSGPFNQESLPQLRLEFQRRTFSASTILSTQSFQREAKSKTFPENIGLRGYPHLAANFIFTIHNPEELDKMIDDQTKAEQLHATMMDEETQALINEQQRYGDLLLVDEIDVYRNIPKKMLRFFSWVFHDTATKFVIKTDDDCFMNIDAILNAIGIADNVHSFWWGSFRMNWPLDVLGKWAEHDYSSPVYPAFACGSGNLLSRDLVDWIAMNAQHLHSYQGEDVSMGIWLVSILPTYVDDPRWQCDSTCHEDVFVLPQLSPQELRSSWQNWEKCKDPCGCS